MRLEHFDSLSFPAWALCAFHYGEESDLTDEEIAQVQSFAEEYPADRFALHFENGEYFSNRPAFGLPCECVDVMVYEIKRGEA